MCWHTKSNNVILLAILLELGRNVRLVAVKNKEAVFPNYTTPCMLIKMLNLLVFNIICSISILT